ncbi:MAG TPA: Uma2 family endonuclease [Streptosporangiaceae bacterium]|nr:Uma2 family endonuclease [Streptosporangiaceae bacterium]
MSEAFATPASYHAGPWTVDEVLELPDNGMRYELVEERLVVSSVPPPRHQRAARRLANLLEAEAPAHLESSIEVNLRIGVELLIPDVVLVMSAALDDAKVVHCADVHIAAEILSPGNIKFDRAWKPRRYAEGGIPYYLEVELDGVGAPRVRAFELRGMGYVAIGEARAGETLALTEPYDIRFDPAQLAGRRG